MSQIGTEFSGILKFEMYKNTLFGDYLGDTLILLLLF